MHIHEFQTKELLKKYGIAVPPFCIVSSEVEIDEAIEKLNLDKAVIKVQIHAGGRGKAGGVKIASSREEILCFGKQLLGMKIVNEQTGKDGMIAHKILISPVFVYDYEYYLGGIIDRKQGQALLIGSPQGGMNIEEVALKNPEKILRIPIGTNGKIRGYHLLEMLKFMGWTGTAKEQATSTIQGLAQAFWDYDASLLEINPLVGTEHGDLVALDAKLSIDDNALYRQPIIADFYDPTQLSRFEVESKKYDLAYVDMEGNIGCMVNGAGLAMATMDIIHYHGGAPANFLDVGGGASQEKIAEGFKILLSDPKVKAILINIFGGIMNCATIALGLISAAAQQKISIPIILRMEGTNVEQGKKLLESSSLQIDLADNLNSAAEKAVAAARSNSKTVR
jgi:succinyl-CoA synthetase beta subunit